jgi:membrane associated rhomboid family serine protease
VLFIIGATFAIQVLEKLSPWASDSRLVEIFGLGPNLIEHWAIWQLLTHAMLHSDFSHLFGNAFMLYLFGDNVEDILGSKLFLKTLVLSIVAGGLVEFFISTIGTPTVIIGISGGVAGIMGMYFYLFPRVKIRFVFFFIVWRFPAWALVAFWVFMQFVGIVQGTSNIAYWAHLGGLAAGLVFAVYEGGFKSIKQRIKAQS